MTIKKAVLSIILVLLLFTVEIFSAWAERSVPDTMRDITTMDLVRDMGIGINLGNTFESFGDWIGLYGDGSVRSYETAWGSPMITREIIQGYANAGFGVLRVPVHWFNLMDEDYNISREYMSAVKETVDWALDAGLYVIINIHHDENGFFADFAAGKEEEHLAAYRKIWSQVAEAFQDAGDYLIFESLNEEGCWDSLWNRWGGTNGKAKAYKLLNGINQAFVDVIRASGGNNAQRHLLIAGYATGIDETCDALFQLPDDPAHRCALSVHYYTPPTFAILEEDANWGKMRPTWGTDNDFAELNRYMDKIKAKLVDQGIPVIIGEYGCPKNNKDPESVRLFLFSVCKAAYERQICPILWDVTGSHYDRTNCKMYDQELMDSLLSVLESP